MRLKVTVSYDGSNYCGWQTQPNGESIQNVIEEVLEKIHKEKLHITGSGRTDAKVHAYGQVFHVDSSIKMNEHEWSMAFNTNLPDDIVVRSVEIVHDEFHARFDAKWKHYTYKVNIGNYDPFKRNYELQLCKDLDVDLIKECAKLFVGTHDFSAFNGNSLEERPNQVRTIFKIDVVRNKDSLVFNFYGEGFLRYMVRMLSQTLIEVGKGRLSVERVGELLEEAVKSSAPYNASAVGLYLVKVGYSEYADEV